MNDQNRYRGNSPRSNPYEGRDQNQGRGAGWNSEDDSSMSDRGNSPRMRSSFRDERDQGSREWSGRSSSDDESFYAERASRDDDSEYGGRGRGSSRGELSGFGAQGRYGNWDTSRDRDPYRSGSSSGSSYGSGSYGSGSRSSGSGSYGSGSYGSGASGSGSYGSGSYGSGDSGSYGSRSYGTGSRSGSYGSGLRSGSYGSGSSYGSYGAGSSGSSSEYSDAQSRSYAGRGPKGYTRSDDRIREDVCERLSENDDVDASDIEVQVADRKVTLSGSVENRRMKHIAEDIAEAVSGVDDVDNRITVRKPFLKDIADRVTGNEGEQHHANSGTKNSPASGISSTSSMSANGRS